jgi:hypothetical protein
MTDLREALRRARELPPAPCPDDLLPLLAPLDGLLYDPGNPRAHPDVNLDAIELSVRLHGPYRPIVARAADGVVAAGNGLLRVLRERMGLGYLGGRGPIVRKDMSPEQFASLSALDNATGEGAERYDRGALEDRLALLRGTAYEVPPDAFGGDLREVAERALRGSVGPGDAGGDASGGDPPPAGSGPPAGGEAADPGGEGDEPAPYSLGPALAQGFEGPFGEPDRGPSWPRWEGEIADRLGFPATTLLDQRDRTWLARKGAWRGTAEGSAPGIVDHVGREHVETWHCEMHGYQEGGAGARTSQFCPVLCELLVRWYTAAGDTVIDPFAGGPTRGVVCAALGRRYVGCELRPEQVAADRAAAEALGYGPGAPWRTAAHAPAPEWREGDSRLLARDLPEADAVLACPPYGPLEEYGGGDADLSMMREEEFLAAYREIVAACCARLRPGRFSAFVVGPWRRADGTMVDLAGITVAAHEAAGCRLYDRAATPHSHSAWRALRQIAGRKLVRAHQEIVVCVRPPAPRLSEVAGGRRLSPA